MRPLSLYIHVPWCVRKCPYCDFNSHQQKETMDQDAYLQALLHDLDMDLDRFSLQNPRIHSIFIGGGTPSILPASFYQQLFDSLKQRLTIESNCEVTLEANPGTADANHFVGYAKAGINRLSIGAQSFNDDMLHRLGRIHGQSDILQAVRMANTANILRINIDLMWALPNQTLEQALQDLQTAIALRPEHISWYQLTLEPNTVFYRSPPELPDEELAWDIQDQGSAILEAAGYEQYEVSAWRMKGSPGSLHNQQYWTFGDYLGIGAGAHGKIFYNGETWRSQKTRMPKDYIQRYSTQSISLHEWETVKAEELGFEFMLNALRLKSGVDMAMYEEMTGRPLDSAILAIIEKQRKLGLLHPQRLQLSEKGWSYYNRIVSDYL